MSNLVTISVEFSFKGKVHRPSVEVQLDRYIKSGTYPDFHQLIAENNAFDLYSYEYEMIQAAPILYSNAEGLVTEFISEGVLNFKLFELAWHENKIQQELDVLVQDSGMESLKTNHTLRELLLKAYQLGLKQSE